MKLRHLLLERKAITNLDSLLKSRDITLPAKVYNQSCGFSRSHVWIWELNCKEGWPLKNWCFWTVVLEKTLENPLDGEEIKSVNLKRNQPWRFIRRMDAEAPIFWPPDVKSQFIRKDTDAWEDWRQEEKEATENKRVGWHPTQWTWVWASSGRWWRRGKPGVLQSMGSQRLRHDWVAEQQQQPIYTVLYSGFTIFPCCCCFSHVWLFETPWTVACQIPLSMGVSR